MKEHLSEQCLTDLLVHVGYEYSTCPDIIWEIQTTPVSGHDMSISEIGGWNLGIHHRYNFHEGILQKGDGANVYLKNKVHMRFFLSLADYVNNCTPKRTDTSNRFIRLDNSNEAHNSPIHPPNVGGIFELAPMFIQTPDLFLFYSRKSCQP